MEKLQRDLFKDPSIEARHAYAGVMGGPPFTDPNSHCTTMVGGAITRCCNAAGMCVFDSGQ